MKELHRQWSHVARRSRSLRPHSLVVLPHITQRTSATEFYRSRVAVPSNHLS